MNPILVLSAFGVAILLWFCSCFYVQTDWYFIREIICRCNRSNGALPEVMGNNTPIINMGE